MKQEIITLLENVKNGSASFADVLSFIDAHYKHEPVAFYNGDVHNGETQNQGSARVFKFAGLNELDEENTLHLFAEHYRAVRDNPEGSDHQNIRQFMRYGWPGVKFEDSLK